VAYLLQLIISVLFTSRNRFKEWRRAKRYSCIYSFILVYQCKRHDTKPTCKWSKHNVWKY